MERKERSYRLIVKGAEFEKAFPIQRFGTGKVQDVMEQLQNKLQQGFATGLLAALHKEQQQIAEAVERAENLQIKDSKPDTA